jgi:hypothetical protein
VTHSVTVQLWPEPLFTYINPNRHASSGWGEARLELNHRFDPEPRPEGMWSHLACKPGTHRIDRGACIHRSNRS